MLLALRRSLAGLVLLTLSRAFAEVQVDAKDAVSIQTASPEPPGSSDDGGLKSTTFNGVEVPPLKELNGEDFNKEIKNGFWYVVTYPTMSVPSNVVVCNQC